MLLKGGYHGITMARIAEAAECAKGTIYQHFSCKEEVIVALAVRSVDEQRLLVERATTFRGRPRERMLAVGEATSLFGSLHEESARVFQIMTGEAIVQKAKERSLYRLRASARRMADMLVGIVRDAIAQGDLVLDSETRPEDVVYPLWVLGEGAKAARSSWFPPGEMGIDAPFAAIIKHAMVLGDGYGWKPLSSEWDYRETLRRIRREVFPEESRKVYGEV